MQADADAIKEHIQKQHQSFDYVNQTVEQALWCEVIKFLEQSEEADSTGSEKISSTQTPFDSSESEKAMSVQHMDSNRCNLQ